VYGLRGGGSNAAGTIIISDNEDVNIIAVEAAGLVDSGEKRNISAKVGLFTEAKLC
jgi:tryptophan synthase beta subunit